MADDILPLAPSYQNTDTSLTTLGDTAPMAQQPGVAANYLPASNDALQTMNKVVAYGLPGMGAGFADTVGQSIGIFNDDTVQNALKAISPNGLGDYYARNREPLRAGGEIAGMFLPGMIGIKALNWSRRLREAGRLGSILKDSTALDLILGSAADLTASEAKISAVAKASAETMGVTAGRTFANPALDMAKRGYYVQRLIETARQTAVFEGSYRALYNNSETFYPSDYTLTDQLRWAGYGFAGMAGLDFAVGRYAVRNLVKAASKDLSAYATSDNANLVDKVISRPGDRGVATAYFARSWQLANDAMKNAGDARLVTSSNQDMIVMENSLQKQIMDMARDGHEFITSTQLDEQQIGNVKNAVKGNENTLLFATKLGQVPASKVEFYAAIGKATDKAAKDLDVQTTLAGLKIGKAERALKYETPDEAQLEDLADLKQLSAEKVAAAQASYDRLQNLSSEWHLVLENTGNLAPFKSRAYNWLDDHSWNVAQRTLVPVKPLMEGAKPYNKINFTLGNLTLDSDFVVHGPKSLTPENISSLYAMGSRFIKEWHPMEGQSYALNDLVPRFEAEGIVNLIEAHPEVQGVTQFGGTFKNLNDAKFDIAAKKYQEWSEALNLRDKKLSGADILKRGVLEPEQITANLNMPASETLQPSPLEQVFGQMRLQGATDLRSALLKPSKTSEFHQQVGVMERSDSTEKRPIFGVSINGRIPGDSKYYPSREAAMEAARAHVAHDPGFRSFGLSQSIMPQQNNGWDLLQAAMREAVGETDPKTTYAISGNMFKQNDIRPVLIASKSIPALSRNDAMLHTMIENRLALQVARLSEISPEDAPILAATIANIGGSAAVTQAKEVRQLFEGQVAGRGVLTQQDRVNDQVPTLKALASLIQENDRMLMKHVGDMFETSLAPKVAAMQLKANYRDLVDFNRIEQSYRHGWEITGLDKSNGMVRFVLDKAAPINKELLIKHFSPETADALLKSNKTLYMPDMSVTARKAMRNEPISLTVSPLAGDLASTISNYSRQSGVETNALRAALGKGAIKIRQFHLPTPELSADGAHFVQNESGDVVATYGRGTENQNKSRAEEAAAQLTKLYGESHTVISLEDVRKQHLFDETFMSFINYSDQLAKSNTAISGGLAHVDIDSTANTLKNMTRSLTQQFLNIGIRGRAALFEPQINFVRNAAQLSGEALFKENNIFNRYLAMMFSRSTQSSQGLVGQGYQWAESKMDNALTYLYANRAEATALNDESRQGAKGLMSLVRGNTAESQLRQFKEKYASWSPFQTTQDWLESTHPEIPTKRAKGFAAELGKVSSTLALRFLDVGTAILNLSGVVATAPPVIAGLRKLAGENQADWVARVGAWGSSVSFMPGVKPFSPMKAMSNVISAFWNGELTEPMARAAQLGMFDPEYSQLAKVLTTPMQAEKGNFGKAIDKFMGAANSMADNSEILSRKISWGMGYKIGKDLLKFDDEKNLYIFANNFLNDMIGNYSPRNKPGMFQGAVGLPLGAFQTYMFNYYRRMYGYLERKDWKTMAAAYGAQASLFGTGSVPGWQLYNSSLFNNYDGSDSLSTRLDRTLPTGVGELLLHGSLSSIPWMMGASSGIAFYPRGSVDWTQVPANPTDWSRMPAAQFLSDVAQGITKTTQNFMGAGGFSVQQQEEILANFTTNRATKFIMEQLAGAKTDRAGEVWDAATNDALHVAAGLLGSQTSEVRRAQDAYNSQQLVEKNQEYLRGELNQKTRAMMRGGEFDVSDLQSVVSWYMKSGGNPAYFGQWLRNTVEASQFPKADKKLAQLASEGKMTEFMNMLAALQQNRPTSSGGQTQGQQPQ